MKVLSTMPKDLPISQSVIEIATAENTEGEVHVGVINMAEEGGVDKKKLLVTMRLSLELMGWKMPSDEHMLRICSLIVMKHPGLNRFEIELAFRLCCEEKIKTSYDKRYVNSLEWGFVNELLHNYKTYKRKIIEKLNEVNMQLSVGWPEVYQELKKHSEASKSLVLTAFSEFLGEGERNEESPMYISVPYSLIYNILDSVFTKGYGKKVIVQEDVEGLKHEFLKKHGYPFKSKERKHFAKMRKLMVYRVFEKIQAKSNWQSSDMEKFLAQFFILDRLECQKHYEKYAEEIKKIKNLILN